MITLALALALALVLVLASADEHHHHHRQSHHDDGDGALSGVEDVLRAAKQARLQARLQEARDTRDLAIDGRAPASVYVAGVAFLAAAACVAVFCISCCVRQFCLAAPAACRDLVWFALFIVWAPIWLLTCGCACRRKRERSGDDAAAPPLTCKFPQCKETRATFRTADGRAVRTSLCEEHAYTEHGPHATELQAFELRPNTKYTCNFRYFARKSAVADSLRSAIDEAAASAAAGADARGFIYVFTSRCDGVRPSKAARTFLYKIGETTQPRATDRVQEWGPDAEFRNTIGYDWWPVSDAPRAESLVHALLGARRYVRYNCIADAEEREWFFVSHAELRTVIDNVVAAVNAHQYSDLMRFQVN